MARELYLYSGIYSWTATSLIASIEESMNEEVIIRLNTGGGSVYDGYGIMAKMREHGNVTLVLDGLAASMGAFMLPYANKVIAYDVVDIMLHRADMYVGDDPERQRRIDSMNATLKAKLEKSVDPETFKKVTGYTLEEMFNPDKRIDVWINARQAKRLGLVDEVKKLDPEAEAAQKAVFAKLNSGGKPEAEANTDPLPKPSNPKNKIMTVAELKSSNPEVYASVLAEGVTKEKNRIEAWMTYNDVDPKAVSEGIESGKEISMKEVGKFSREAAKQAALASFDRNNPEGVDQDDTDEDGSGDGGSPEGKSEYDQVKAELHKKLNIGK